MSAIIPTYNRKGHVERAVRSILSQTPGPAELIVVDDGSTDGTADDLAAVFGGAVRIVRQPNGGVSQARRRGVMEARGDWIAFLDSDDVWMPGRLAALTAARDAVETADWVFGDTEIIDDTGGGGTLFRTEGLAVERPVTLFEDALPLQHPFQFSLLQSSLIRRAALLSTEAFAENLRSSEDFLVSFRLGLRSPFAAIPQVVTQLYRTRDLRSSSLSASWRADPDYYRARVIALSEAAAARGPAHWGALHAEAVRGWCRVRAQRREPVTGLALTQLRHHRSAKGLIFAAAGLLGPAGVRLWSRVASATVPG